MQVLYCQSIRCLFSAPGRQRASHFWAQPVWPSVRPSSSRRQVSDWPNKWAARSAKGHPSPFVWPPWWLHWPVACPSLLTFPLARDVCRWQRIDRTRYIILSLSLLRKTGWGDFLQCLVRSELALTAGFINRLGRTVDLVRLLANHTFFPTNSSFKSVIIDGYQPSLVLLKCCNSIC